MYRTGRGLYLESHPLEEDDIFLAGFFLVEWCGVWWHGWEGCPPGLEGEALGGHISWGWARGLAGGVWKRRVRGVSSHRALWVAPLPGQLGSPEGGTELWLLSWMGLSEQRFREVFSSLPINLLRSSCCFRSNEAERGRAQPEVLGFAPRTHWTTYLG